MGHVIVIINLHETKNKKDRFFTVKNSECNGYNLFRKYYDLRPSNVEHNRFSAHWD